MNPASLEETTSVRRLTRGLAKFMTKQAQGK
jgi:hypothetical protein